VKIAALRKRDGGLGVLNVELQIQAIRSKWIAQWFSDEPQKWKSIVTWFLEESTKKTNLGMNIFKTDRYIPWIKITPFWDEVLDAWRKLNISRIRPSEKRIDILNEPIHRNPLIRLANDQTIRYKQLLDCGIYTIKNLMIGDRFPMTWELEHFSDQKRVQDKIVEVISCLNDKHLEVLRFRDTDLTKEETLTPMNQQFGFIDSQQNKITLEKMPIKSAYRHGVKINYPLPYLEVEIRWESRWGTGRLIWEPIWKGCFNVTIPNNMKELTWKILHFIIHTRKSKSKYDREVSPICLLCGEEDETIPHLWYSCSYARFLWSWYEQIINFGRERNIIMDEFKVITNAYNLEMERKLQLKKERLRALLFEIKWQIWTARNDILWGKKATISKTQLLMITKNSYKQRLMDYTQRERKEVTSIGNEKRMVEEIIEALEQSTRNTLRELNSG
jgi:hypothetical protein